MSSKINCFEEVFASGPYYNLKHFSDATLQSKDAKVYHIHRLVLASKCEYFRALFNFNINCKEFSLPRIKSSILEQILIYLYTDQTRLTLENIPDLLHACDFLLLDKLSIECSSFSMKNIDIPNCLPLLMAARMLTNESLFQYCYRFVQLYFEDVMEKSADELEALDIDILKMFLAEKNLNISSEEFIWRTIRVWIEADLTTREKFVPEMLKYLNFGVIDKYSAFHILKHPIVSKNKFCREINKLMANSARSLMANSARDVLEIFQNHPVFSVGKTRIPLFINAVVKINSSVEPTQAEFFITFDEKLDACHKICDLDFYPTHSIIVDRTLHLFNPCSRGEMFSYDLEKNMKTTYSRTLFSPLLRYYHIVQLANGIVYCLESKPESNEYCELLNNTVEKYEPQLGEWTFAASLRPMLVHHIACCCDRIYTFGSFLFDAEGGTACMCAQMYNPETDAWSGVVLPEEERIGGTIATYKNKLLLIGGESDDHQFQKDVIEFDPVTNSWSSKPPLPISYIEPETAMVGDVLHIYENVQSDFEEDCSKPPVFWDEDHQTWKVVQETSPFFNLRAFFFCSISDPETIKRVALRRRGQNWLQNYFL